MCIRDSCKLAVVFGFCVGKGSVASIEDEPQGLVGPLGLRPHEDDGWDFSVVLAVGDDLLPISGSPFQ
eukprot:7998559-Heterocapsa_arctica.AAC.1